jgi:2-methylisocitrate lyase-like PEP mutase family enzyme
VTPAQAIRGEKFRLLHERAGIFAIPNPWDAGSARMLALLGFDALATTSAGFAFSLGKPDAEGAVDRRDTLAHVRTIVDATSLPVSADLENGFGDDPETCAETIRLAAGRSRTRLERRTIPSILSTCRSSVSLPPSRPRALCRFHSC